VRRYIVIVWVYGRAEYKLESCLTYLARYHLWKGTHIFQNDCNEQCGLKMEKQCNKREWLEVATHSVKPSQHKRTTLASISQILHAHILT
jgi:hypothetical protein